MARANPSVKINATTFDSDDCVQDAQLTINGIEATYFCSGNEVGAISGASIMLTFSLVLALADTAKVAVLDAVLDKPQAAVTMEYHPGGDTATYIEATTTAGLVKDVVFGSPANGLITADVTCRWNNLTLGAAS